MADGRIGATKGYFDHNNVEGEANFFVGETPVSEFFVCGTGFNSNKGVKRSGGIGEESDPFEFGVVIHIGFYRREGGGLSEGYEHEENLIVTGVEITAKKVNF